MEEGSKASRQTVALGSAGKAPWLPTRREFPSPYPFFFFFLSLKAGVVLNSISGEILFTFQVVVIIVVLGFHCVCRLFAAVHRLLVAARGLLSSRSTDPRAPDLSS